MCIGDASLHVAQAIAHMVNFEDLYELIALRAKLANEIVASFAKCESIEMHPYPNIGTNFGLRVLCLLNLSNIVT